MTKIIDHIEYTKSLWLSHRDFNYQFGIYRKGSLQIYATTFTVLTLIKLR